MTNFLRLIGMIPSLVLMTVGVILSFVLLAVWMAFVAIVMAIMWTVGCPMWITVRGKKQGYYRWFTYHRK